LATAAAIAAQGTPPTWSRDVAPLIHRACAGCHRPGQPVPFPLLGFDDVWKRREMLVEVTQLRRMPPWLPTHGDLLGDRRLRADEIELLRAWAAAGGPRGDAKDEPAPPTFASDWQFGEPHLVVHATAPLAVAASGPDVVRNLVIPVGVDRLRYVEAVEIRPGNRAVHHAVLAVDETRQSRRRDHDDAEPGFAGMSLGAAVPPDGHFLGWTPGKSVRRNAPGSAWRLRPGADLVLQLHVVPTGKNELVQPEIGFWFTDVPTTTTYAPVVLFSEAIDIAPGVADFVLRDHFVLPVPATLHALYPHAHRICRRMRATATLPGGGVRVLLAIDAWDFDWQDDYRLRVPMPLPAGTTLAIEYEYDNSEANPANPSRPPRRVRFGQQSADEMGTMTFALTVEPADVVALEEAHVARQLEKLPDAWNLLLQQARFRRDRGDLAGAKAALVRARTISPGSADVVLELGLCAEREGRLDDAARAYHEALVLDPGHGLAHVQLGVLAGRDARATEARQHFARALQVLPHSAVVHGNFANACFQLDELELAATHYRRAVAIDPEYFGPWLNLGRVLARLGQRDEARAALQRALALRPGHRDAAAELEALAR